MGCRAGWLRIVVAIAAFCLTPTLLRAHPAILHLLPAQAPALSTPSGSCGAPEDTCRHGSARCACHPAGRRIRAVWHTSSSTDGGSGGSARRSVAGSCAAAAGGSSGGGSGGCGGWHALAGAAGGSGAASGRPHAVHLPALHPGGAAPGRPAHPAHQRCGDRKAAHGEPAWGPQPQPVFATAPRLMGGGIALEL